jgi:cell division septation protein DedD
MKNDIGPTTRNRRNGELGASQNLLLGILAALIALLGYLYFFTGVIKERDVQQKSLPTVVQKVKQPIPPRPAAEDNKLAVVPPAQDTKKAVPVPAAIPAKPQASPPPMPPKAATPLVKPVADQQKKVPPPAQSPAKPEKPASPKAQPPLKKTVGTDESSKKAAVAKPTAATPPTESGYQILVSGISSQDKAQAVVAELKKGKAEKIAKKQISEEKSMKRLYVGEFDDSQSAYSELEKTKKISAGAFLLPVAGKYELYAGSYDQENRAEGEIKRLAGQGLNATLKKAKVKMSVIVISAVARDKKQADEMVKRLRKLGVAAEAKTAAK